MSMYKIPRTKVPKARYPAIDMDGHDNAKTDANVTQWVKTLDAVGIEKVITMTMATGQKSDDLVRKYTKYPERFQLSAVFEVRKEFPITEKVANLGVAPPNPDTSEVPRLRRVLSLGDLILYGIVAVSRSTSSASTFWKRWTRPSMKTVIVITGNVMASDWMMRS